MRSLGAEIPPISEGPRRPKWARATPHLGSPSQISMFHRDIQIWAREPRSMVGSGMWVLVEVALAENPRVGIEILGCWAIPRMPRWTEMGEPRACPLGASFVLGVAPCHGCSVRATKASTTRWTRSAGALQGFPCLAPLVEDSKNIGPLVVLCTATALRFVWICIGIEAPSFPPS